MNDLPISKILLKYETDKVSIHCYGDAYDELFSPFDRNAHLNILEVGTQKGGSLCAWKEYFPNSTVTGIDIIDVVKPEYNREGITHIISDINHWDTDQTFDIIIDDGSHALEDILYVIKEFSPKLKKGGLMIVEDVQSPSWLSDIRVPFTVRDMRYIKGSYDDYLIVIQK